MRVQRVDPRAQGFGVAQRLFFDVTFQAGALPKQFFAPRQSFFVLRLRRGIGHGALQRFQLRLLCLALRPQRGELGVERVELRLLLRGQGGERLHGGDGGLCLRKLRLQRFALRLRLRERLGKRLVGELGKRIVDLPKGVALFAGEQALALGDLRLRAVELRFHVGQFLVHFAEDEAVEKFDAVFVDGDGDSLLHRAGDGHGGHAVDALQFGQQRFVDEVRQFAHVRPFEGHGGNGDGQHVRVDLHHHRRAHRIAPGAAQHVDLRGELDQHAVHVHAALKFEDDNRKILCGCGGDAADVGKRGKRCLHGPGHIALHLFRRRAHIGRIYGHIGQIHVRQKIRGHVGKGDHAEHDDQYDADDNGIGLLDAEFRQHAKIPPDHTLYRLWRTISSICLYYHKNSVPPSCFGHIGRMRRIIT